MGAARFAAVIAAREQADPEYRQRRLAQRELGREIWKLETKYRDQITTLQRDLGAAQTALTEAQVTNSRLARRAQASDEAYQQELTIAHTAVKDLETENARLKTRLRQCDAVNKLIQAATQEGQLGRDDGDT
jgi:hypothetical protein